MQQTKLVRRSALALALAALVVGSLPAEARVGSSPSMSSPRSASSMPAPRPSMPASTPSRVGGGQSMGMQRSNVMESVRSNPAPSAPVASGAMGGTGGGYRPMAAPAPMPAPTAAAPAKDRSWVAPAAAGVAVGALTTYALTDHSNHTQPIAAPQAPAYPQANGGQPGNPGYQPGYGAAAATSSGYAQAPQGYAPMAAPQSSSGFGFGSFLILLLLGGLGYLAYRKFVVDAAPSVKSAQRVTVPGFNESTDLAKAKALFNELQVLNNKGDLPALDVLKTKTTPELFTALERDILLRLEPSSTEVVQLDGTVVDDTHEGNRRILSVRFIGLVRESAEQAPDAIDEVWHFVKSGSDDWKVAGIEQV